MAKVWSDYSNRYIDTLDQSLSTTYDMIAQQYTNAGYRGISHKHRRVARIDRPDWYTGDPRQESLAASADRYRRCHTSDTMQLATYEVYKRIPSSGYDIADPFANEPDIEEEDDTDMMNLTNVAALLRDDTTTVVVRHLNDTRVDGSAEYTYKALKSLAATLKIGDQVLVKNTKGVSIAEVHVVHDEPQIDLESKGSKAINFRWAFQRVDAETAERLEEEDRQIVDRLKSRQVQNTRDQAMAMLGITDASEVLMGITDKTTKGK